MITRLEVEEEFRKETIKELVEEMSYAIRAYAEAATPGGTQVQFPHRKFAGIWEKGMVRIPPEGEKDIGSPLYAVSA